MEKSSLSDARNYSTTSLTIQTDNRTSRETKATKRRTTETTSSTKIAMTMRSGPPRQHKDPRRQNTYHRHNEVDEDGEVERVGR